jgi:cell division protease FtsH
VTMFLPEEDRYSHSRRAIESKICSFFGGRIAEQMVLGPDGITTGASNDIEHATRLARNMVAKWGLSDRIGPLKYDEDDGEVFLGMSAGVKTKPISDETARIIDEEVRRIIDECYQRAEAILRENESKLHLMAESLIEYETLTSAQIDDIMAGAKPRTPTDDAGPQASTETPKSPGDARNIGGPAEEH